MVLQGVEKKIKIDPCKQRHHEAVKIGFIGVSVGFFMAYLVNVSEQEDTLCGVELVTESSFATSLSLLTALCLIVGGQQRDEFLSERSPRPVWKA